MNKQKHLTLDSRIMIETKLNEGQGFKAIGRFLNKDCTTISKEVKNHISFEKSGAYGKSFNDCLLAFQRKCSAQKVCPGCASRNNRLNIICFPALITQIQTDFIRNLSNIFAVCGAAVSRLHGIAE